MTKFEIGDKITVTNSGCNHYNNRNGVIEEIDRRWHDDANYKIYKVKLSGFKGYLWFSDDEISTQVDAEFDKALVDSAPLSKWLSK